MSTPLITTFTSYVPRLIRQRLAAVPSPLTEPQFHTFSAAVLFADISGFTALTERLAEQGSVGAEILTQELNSYFGRLISIIEDYGGDVVKFAGDALTAVWPSITNATESHTTATIQAAACALTIQTDLHAYQTDSGDSLTLRIGLGAGEVAMVHIGSIYGRWEYLITGLPLTQVSQAEAQAQPGEVVASPEVWQLGSVDI